MVAWMLALVAVLVTVIRVNSLTVWVGMTGRTGATFTSWTMTVKLLVALNGGEPLSVTRVVRVLVLGLWVWVGVQVMIPVWCDRRAGRRASRV